MAGQQIAVTFPQETAETLKFVAKRLHFTPQQVIRLAVEEYLQDKDPFVLAGGKDPNE